MSQELRLATAANLLADFVCFVWFARPSSSQEWELYLYAVLCLLSSAFFLLRYLRAAREARAREALVPAAPPARPSSSSVRDFVLRPRRWRNGR